MDALVFRPLQTMPRSIVESEGVNKSLDDATPQIDDGGRSQDAANEMGLSVEDWTASAFLGAGGSCPELGVLRQLPTSAYRGPAYSILQVSPQVAGDDSDEDVTTFTGGLGGIPPTSTSGLGGVGAKSVSLYPHSGGERTGGAATRMIGVPFAGDNIDHGGNGGDNSSKTADTAGRGKRHRAVGSTSHGITTILKGSAKRIQGRAESLVPLIPMHIYTKLWRDNRQLFWRRLGMDAIAGLTVGAMVVPQAMSYATIAGLQPVFGLYNALIGIVPYPLLGTAPQLVPGPTAVLSIMVKEAVPGVVDGVVVSDAMRHQMAFALSFLVAIWQLIAGWCGLGYLVQLVAAPVVSGFTSAAAFLIASTQMATLLGVQSCKRSDGHACNLVDAIKNIVNESEHIVLSVPLSSFLCIGFLVAYRKLCRRYLAPRGFAFVGKFGPIILVIVTISIAYHLNAEAGTCVLGTSSDEACGIEAEEVIGKCCDDRDPFKEAADGVFDYTTTVKVYDKEWFWRQVGPIQPGLPPFFNSLGDECYDPDPSDSATTKASGGVSGDAVRSCFGSAHVQALLPASFIIAVIAYLESMVIGTTVAAKYGGEMMIRPSNELFALGACNAMSAFFQGYPVTGSFSRTAVNGEAGASSALSLAFCAIVVMICLQHLTPVLAYLPKLTLASIITESVVKLVEIDHMRFLLNTSRRDFSVMIVTFFGVLFGGIEVGLIVGILLGWVLALPLKADMRCEEIIDAEEDKARTLGAIPARASTFNLSALGLARGRFNGPGVPSTSAPLPSGRGDGTSASSLASQYSNGVVATGAHVAEGINGRRGQRRVLRIVTRSSLTFANCAHIRRTVQGYVDAVAQGDVVLVVDLSAVVQIDATAIDTIDKIVSFPRVRFICVVVSDLCLDAIGLAVRHNDSMKKRWGQGIALERFDDTLDAPVAQKAFIFRTSRVASIFACRRIDSDAADDDDNTDRTSSGTRDSVSSSALPDLVPVTDSSSNNVIEPSDQPVFSDCNGTDAGRDDISGPSSIDDMRGMGFNKATNGSYVGFRGATL